MSVQGIIGKKVGMTQVFADDGQALPVTVIEAGPCVVVQRKSKDEDGYSAVQLGLVEARKIKRVTKPMKGHFDKAGLPPCRVLREFRVGRRRRGQGRATRSRSSCSPPGTRSTSSGTSKGKGFQGVIKRHGFGGGEASHGSMFHRAPGSIGQSAYPVPRPQGHAGCRGTWAPSG